jgi:oligopeptide/dipeptide ABC transporter ATP-binding protein
MNKLLSISDVDVSYGKSAAVRGFSLDVAPGEVVVLVGESGSGKSTLGLALLGLLEGASVKGSARLRSKDEGETNLLTAAERQMQALRGSRISMVTQEPMSSLNPMFRVGTQIIESIRVHTRMSKAEAGQLSIDLLRQMGITTPERCMASFPHQLSGGQKQRVAIAMAVANKPDILIADEPTTALDVTVQAQIIVLLAKLRQTYNMAILFITHDLNIARKFADRIVVMYAGEIVETGSAEEIFSNPKMPYTSALIRSRPRFDASGMPIPLQPIQGVASSAATTPSGCSFNPRCQHRVVGRCDHIHPSLEAASTEQSVRCLRWRELQ